jgi:hypothetical protein
MDLGRAAKRKAFEEVLELAKGQLGETLKGKSPKVKAMAIKVVDKGKEKPCADCEEGTCEEHDAEGVKAKLKSLYEQMAEE